MSHIFRLVLLLFALALAVASLTLVPAGLCRMLEAPSVWVASLFYFVFFLSTINRVRVHGSFTPREKDAQVKSAWGKVAYPIQFLGLGGAHWLAVYDYSQNAAPELLWSIVGLMLMLVALVVNRLAARELGRFWDRLVIQEKHQLVTSGIYSVVRHPIYTSYLLLFFGHMVFFQSLWASLLLAVVCAVWFGTRIKIEESLLLSKFGEDYAQYMRQTKRLVPFLF